MSSLQWAYIMVLGCMCPYTQFGHVCWYMYKQSNLCWLPVLSLLKLYSNYRNWLQKRLPDNCISTPRFNSSGLQLFKIGPDV